MKGNIMYNQFEAIDSIVSEIKGMTNLISKTLFNKNYIIIACVVLAALVTFLSFN
jgi:hypothetical protein